MNPTTTSDQISNLPAEVLVSVLTFLPLPDAARTTVLNSKWRPLFYSLPRLVFDNTPDLQVIATVLDSRQPIPPLLSFHVHSCFAHTTDVAFDDIVGRLCDNGIREINLDNTSLLYHIPKSVYACQTLQKLELNRCSLHVPQTFNGLRSLRYLRLECVQLSDNELDRIMSRCESLEEFFLLNCFTIENVRVNSKSLVSLQVRQSFASATISTKGGSCLRHVDVEFSIDFEDLGLNAYEDRFDTSPRMREVIVYERERLVKFLTELEHAECLMMRFSKDFFEVLRQLPERLPDGIVLPKLKKLVMTVDMFIRMTTSLMSFLLNSFPNLEDITVTARGYTRRQQPDFIYNFKENSIASERPLDSVMRALENHS